MRVIPDDAEAFWEFCENADAKELLEQLNAGLIHPLEYAHKIEELARKQGLMEDKKDEQGSA